jgi:hypothetical protein
MGRARKPAKAAKRRKPSQTNAKSAARPAGQANGTDTELDEFLAELRVSRRGNQLPQGCTPTEKRAYLEALARLRGVKPIDDPATMVADFWPAQESADDFVAAVRALRRQAK